VSAAFFYGEATMAKEPKKTAEVQAQAVEEAEKAAEVSGTPSPVLEPEKSKMPEPGLTEDTAEIINTDQAHSLNPNVTVSGTKPLGDGTYALLDTVDPAVANAALLPKGVSVKPQSPSEAPPDTTRIPGEGEVLFETTADNGPFWSGNGVGQGGPLKKGQRVVMTKEEAELLVQTKAGRIVSSAPSDSNAQVEGNDVA
jgi:hypothetical protein